MIIYQENLRTFIDQCNTNVIANLVLEKLRENHVGGGAESEFNSWQNSLPKLASVLNDNEINKNIDVAVEYKLFTSKERVDFLIYGKDDNDKDSLVTIELKQWSKVNRSNLENFVLANVANSVVEDHLHPSYQAYEYENFLKAFNEYVFTQNVRIGSCSYCHNMPQTYKFLLENEKIYPLIDESPIFLSGDEQKLKEFIKKYVKKPYKELLYIIDDSKIRPSKKFSELFLKAMTGSQFATLDLNQSFSVSTVVASVEEAIKNNVRRTIIIHGGPGTGKSVVAINILGKLIHPSDGGEPKNACYCTANFTPKTLYSEILIDGDYKKSTIKNLFKGINAFASSSEFDYDCIICDEAHRAYKWKFGYGVSKNIDMIDRLFNASRVNVFFIDEDQAVTVSDYLNVDLVKKYAQKYNSTIIEGERLSLNSQFRCLGGENYIAFIRSLLGYDNNETRLIKSQYDFKVFDDPNEMKKAIEEKQRLGFNARFLAGYTHEWLSFKKGFEDYYDIELPGGFKMKWNKKTTISFPNDTTQYDRVGCIHTSQGADFEYAGVIIGKDLICINGKICFDKAQNAKSDRDSGIRRANDEIAKKLIRNTYLVLLTRGIRGTYIYCEDKELASLIKSLMN